MKMELRHYGIIVFTLATAFLHLAVFPDIGAQDPIFLNGFGYLALLAIYFLPQFRGSHKRDWWALMGYTVLTLVLWVFIGNLTFAATRTSAIGYYAKTAEILLIMCLWLDRPADWNRMTSKSAQAQ